MGSPGQVTQVIVATDLCMNWIIIHLQYPRMEFVASLQGRDIGNSCLKYSSSDFGVVLLIGSFFTVFCILSGSPHLVGT